MSADNPQNPFTLSLTPGGQPQLKSIGRGGEIFAQEIHGKYYTGAYYSRVYSFNLTALTLPIVTATLTSKFSLYNPPTSTVNLELVDIDVGLVTATTVVDTVGLYWQGPTLASLATLTTIGVFNTNWFPGILGGNAGQGNPYSSLVHSGTPVRVDIAAQFGATTATNDTPIHKEYDGKILVTPGSLITAAMSTTVSQASTIDLGIRWMECNVT